jgi:lipopolysaccharide transport system ATP-binding protein
MRRAKRILSPKRNGTRSATIKEEFWALKDINFEIAQGDRVGIIGRNGAGKSTLLKILSRITEPTTGKITICSRVASLLEVGTGFHPELSGRENIFLNGAILGMSRSEIRKKFDEIVEFAEIERFLDTPVKKYSSGMYVRLAFAVAAHLEPEILVVDEVLAVGDAQFQKKCLGKMQDVSRNEGRTVLFVSHNMQAISNLCNKGIYLANGALILHDDVDKAVETYLTHGERFSSHAEVLAKIGAIRPDPDYRLEDIRLFQDGKEVDNNIVNGKDLEVSIDYELYNKITGFRVFIDLCDDMGTVIFRSFHDELKEGITTMGPGRYLSKFTMPRDILAPLTYDLRIWFGIHTIRMLPPGDGINIRINVEQTGNYNRAYNGQYTAGRICIPFPWEINKL